MQMTTPATSLAARESASRQRRGRALLILAPVLLVVIVISIGIGSVDIRPLQVISILLSWVGIAPIVEFTAIQERTLHAIRLPRVLLCALAGAALSVSRAAMRGPFRH